ncbi:MAG: DUF6465 family protein [Lachnospiraceae bacterium]|nr:DUF6465 family protein [Lachnospiraceae bacterium]
MKNETKKTVTAQTAKAAPVKEAVKPAAPVSAKEDKVVEEKTPALKTAEKVVEKVAAKTAEVVAKTEKAAAKTEKAAEKAVVKTEKAVKTAVKKTTAAAKKTIVKEQVYLQYLGKEISKDDIMKQVKEIWTKQLKKKAAEMKSVTIYLKPEENAAYYVINEEETGKIAL